MSLNNVPIQVGARLTALSAAAKALVEVHKGGKAREARLDKALAKLDKTEQPDLGASFGGARAPAAAAPAADAAQQEQRPASPKLMDVVCMPRQAPGGKTVDQYAVYTSPDMHV